MQYDIVIIGGGMVGASLACALKDSNLRVALVDAAPNVAINDPRLIALTYGSCALFKNLGIWPTLAPHATAIKQIHVSQRGQFGITRIHANEVDLDTLGHLIPAKYINLALEEKFSVIENLDVFRSATLTQLKKSEPRPSGSDTSDLCDIQQSGVPLPDGRGSDTKVSLHIQTPNGIEHLETRFVIGADGTNSTVRELLGISTKTTDYNQSALVTATVLQRHHNNIAYERFQAEGAIAMLPLTDNRAATIWTDSTENITRLMQLSDAEFLAELQQAFGYRLGRFLNIEKRYTYPLKLTVAEEYQKQNILLIGNAAHTVHPIASQGLNLALREIAELAESFEKNSSLPPNKKQTWPIQLSHQLTQIFSTDFFVLNISRQLGMIGLDNCMMAKRFFMRKAMGRSGTIPHLLREKESYETDNTGQ